MVFHTSQILIGGRWLNISSIKHIKSSEHFLSQRIFADVYWIFFWHLPKSH